MSKREGLFGTVFSFITGSSKVEQIPLGLTKGSIDFKNHKPVLIKTLEPNLPTAVSVLKTKDPLQQLINSTGKLVLYDVRTFHLDSTNNNQGIRALKHTNPVNLDHLTVRGLEGLGYKAQESSFLALMKPDEEGSPVLLNGTLEDEDAVMAFSTRAIGDSSLLKAPVLTETKDTITLTRPTEIIADDVLLQQLPALKRRVQTKVDMIILKPEEFQGKGYSLGEDKKQSSNILEFAVPIPNQYLEEQKAA